MSDFRLHRRLAAIACLLALPGCEFGEQAIAAREPRPVVHAVLNPFTFTLTYTILLERTLTGRVETTDTLFDPAAPIVTGGGDPITQATVTICNVTQPQLGCAIGVEDVSVRADGKGRGVYRFINNSCQLGPCPINDLIIRRGVRYSLHVQTPTGEIVEGETTVPVPMFNPDTALTTVFNRERDTVRATWPAAELTHRYLVQAQSPYGPISIFTVENAVTFTGDLVNFQVERLPHVFTPGFRQRVQVAAVDTNYFDYYRSENNEFTGIGILNRLRGGTGVFGADVPIRESAFEVVGTIDQPYEGIFAGADDRWSIYDNGPGLVSGRLDWFDDNFNTARYGILGTRNGNRLRLAILRGESARDTLWVTDAEVTPQELVATDSLGREIRRQRLAQ